MLSDVPEWLQYAVGGLGLLIVTVIGRMGWAAGGKPSTNTTAAIGVVVDPASVIKGASSIEALNVTLMDQNRLMRELIEAIERSTREHELTREIATALRRETK